MSDVDGLAGSIRAQFREVCPAHAAQLIELACAGFFPAIKNVHSELRENRESLAAVKDALSKVSLTLGPLHKHYPPAGLAPPRCQVSGPPLPAHLHSYLANMTAHALTAVQQEIDAITRNGRPRERAPAGLARAIITILTDAKVPKVKHRAVLTHCFDWLGLGPKAEASFRAARKKKVD